MAMLYIVNYSNSQIIIISLLSINSSEPSRFYRTTDLFLELTPALGSFRTAKYSAGFRPARANQISGV